MSSSSTTNTVSNGKVTVYGPRLAADIGGTLGKLVFFKRKDVPQMPAYVKSDSDELASVPLPVKLDPKLSIESPDLGGELKFLRIPSVHIPDFVEFLLKTGIHRSYGDTINITGGGAYKFESIIKERLSIKVQQMDEMEMVIRGLDFLINHVQREVFSYEWDTNKQHFLKQEDLHGVYPYLLVNIGSGVSIIKCDGPDKFERVSGSSLGGGMFWGLTKLLTGLTEWDDVKKLSSAGDNKNVDLLVGDIYGRDYSAIGLSSDVIASSFGKIAAMRRDDADDKFAKSDIIRSLLFMTANNIAQIAYLNAARYGVTNIFFAGSFIDRNPYIWDRLSYALEFWSKKQMTALFLLHEGYCGAVGAFLHSSTIKRSDDNDNDEAK